MSRPTPRRRLRAAIPLALLLLSAPLCAAGLPPMRLVGSFDYDELLKRLQQEPLLANISKDLYGSPILLRVTHAVAPTVTGTATGVTSAMLAGSSLGLLPVVENKDLVITYDLFVNDSLIGTYEYKENFTRAFNMYSKDKTQGLGEEGQAWALGTVKLFAADLAKNPKVEALIAEYQLYFPDAKKEQKPAGQ